MSPRSTRSTTRLGAGVAVRTPRGAGAGARAVGARRARGTAISVQTPPASGSRPVNEKKAFSQRASLTYVRPGIIQRARLADLQSVLVSDKGQGDASLSSQWTNDALPDELPGTQLGHARTGRSSYAPPMCPIEATAAIATCCT